MFSLPSPLHPALVHFPIALILVGAVVAVAAVFIGRRVLPPLSAGLLAAAALGTVAAAWTGGQEEEMAGELASQAEQALDAHEDWGIATRNAALIAAVLAVGAAAARRLPRFSRGLSVLAAAAALWASVCVAQAGHYGGQLVYRHGVGVNAADATESARNGEPHAGED
jgi:uncharacterized membrane protein